LFTITGRSNAIAKQQTDANNLLHSWDCTTYSKFSFLLRMAKNLILKLCTISPESRNLY